MDQRLVLLDARVADAADAWLNDPRDAAVYARLVAAIGERRRHLAAAPEAGAAAGAGSAPGEAPEQVDDVHPASDDPGATQNVVSDDPVSEDASEGDASEVAASVRPVGDALAGDPREALARLRRGY